MTMNWSSKPAWYVIRPAFRHDAAAAEDLEAAGFTVFQPSYKRFTLIRHTKGRRRAVTLPLTPGYLFVKLSASDMAKLDAMLQHDRLNRNARARMKHVASFYRIGSERRPPVCNEKAVAQLIEKCAAGVFDQGKTRSGDGYLKDDRIRIVEGPMAGFVVRFKDGRCRPGSIRVLLDRMFGKDTEITLTVSAEAVEAA